MAGFAFLGILFFGPPLMVWYVGWTKGTQTWHITIMNVDDERKARSESRNPDQSARTIAYVSAVRSHMSERAI